MKKGFVDLKPTVDALRSYVPTLRKVAIDNDKGAFNNISFGELVVKHHVRTQSSSRIFNTLRVVQAKHKGYDYHFPALQKKSIKCLQRLTQSGDSQSINSPFIQKYLYQGEKGRITERASGDIIEILEKLPREKFLTFNLKEFISQILLAVYALHHQDMVHRDIKLENFLVNITDDGSLHLELADLDSVMYVHENDFMIIGTPTYSAPEITYKKYGVEFIVRDLAIKADKKAVDCYALGITLLRIVNWYKKVRQGMELQEVDDLRPFDEMIKGLLEPDPKKRFTITQAMEQSCFGEITVMRTDYFAQVIQKFKRPDVYYDSYYQASEDYYPADNDAFLLLPAPLKKIYHIAADLDDCLKICETSPNALVIEAIRNKSSLLMRKINECEAKALEAPKEIMNAFKKNLTKVKLSLVAWEAQALSAEKFQSIVSGLSH